MQQKLCMSNYEQKIQREEESFIFRQSDSSFARCECGSHIWEIKLVPVDFLPWDTHGSEVWMMENWGNTRLEVWMEERGDTFNWFMRFLFCQQIVRTHPELRDFALQNILTFIQHQVWAYGGRLWGRHICGACLKCRAVGPCIRLLYNEALPIPLQRRSPSEKDRRKIMALREMPTPRIRRLGWARSSVSRWQCW